MSIFLILTGMVEAFADREMLGAGTLTRPLDIFDLFLHGTPLALFVVKIFIADRRGSSDSADGK